MACVDPAETVGVVDGALAFFAVRDGPLGLDGPPAPLDFLPRDISRHPLDQA